jgi:hypothetical protein
MPGLRYLLLPAHHQLKLLRWRVDYWLMIQEYEASLRSKG